MMQWNAIPLKGINTIEFGMSRQEVRKSLDGFIKEFKKNKFSKCTTDDFGYCHVFYDAQDCCEAVELFSEVTICVEENTIFPAECEFVQTVFDDFVWEEDSLISKKYSIGIYAPGNKMESILFAAAGYYES